MINKAKQPAKMELITNAKAKFMEEYFLMSQELKKMTSKKGEEYDAIVKKIEQIEHHMECLETLNAMVQEQLI